VFSTHKLRPRCTQYWQDKLSVAGSEQQDKLSVAGSEEQDKLSVAGSEQQDKLSVAGSEQQDKLSVAGSKHRSSREYYWERISGKYNGCQRWMVYRVEPGTAAGTSRYRQSEASWATVSVTRCDTLQGAKKLEGR